MNYLSRLIESKPEHCVRCQGRIYYIGKGIYHCRACGIEQLDDYGKIRAFVKDNDATSALFISQATGVCMEIVEYFMQHEFEELPKGSEYYHECEKCGSSVRQGRYCAFCVTEITGGIKSLFDDDRRRIGYIDPNMTGKMHINNRRKY